MAKLLAVDLDGTLMYPTHIKHCIPKKNVEFLRKWIELGNKVVVITSRQASFVDRIRKEIGYDIDYIASTASTICIDGKIIKDETLDGAIIEPLVNQFEEKFQPIAQIAITRKYPFVINPRRDYSSKFFAWFYRTYWKTYFARRELYVLDRQIYFDQIRKNHVYKIMIFFGLSHKNKMLSKDVCSEIREKYKNIEASWSTMIVEITPKDCSKANGLLKYCEVSNMDKNDVYVVGDSGNDITMFKAFPEHSYCMKHAYPSVKKYAKHVIRRVHNLDKYVLKGE